MKNEEASIAYAFFPLKLLPFKLDDVADTTIFNYHWEMPFGYVFVRDNPSYYLLCVITNFVIYDKSVGLEMGFSLHYVN